MKTKLFLIGGGGHCHSCIDVIESSGKWEIVGIFDPNLDRGTKIMGYPVLGNDDEITNYKKTAHHVLITIGQIKNPDIRKNKYKDLASAGFTFPTIISPRSYVAGTAHLGAGTIVMHDALVNANSRVGANCIINTKALIEHDAVIGDNCHIATAAVINGNVNVGECSFVGSNSVVKQGIQIEARSVIPAGLFFKGHL